MYEPPKPKCTWYHPQDQHYLHSNKKGEINYEKNIKYNFSYGIHDYFQ